MSSPSVGKPFNKKVNPGHQELLLFKGGVRGEPLVPLKIEIVKRA
jgi:hypothetical protein